MDTGKLVALSCPICVDFREGGKPEYPKKNLRSTWRLTAETLTHETSHKSLGFTRAS